MRPGRTGYRLCSSPPYIGGGVSAAGPSARSSGGKQKTRVSVTGTDGSADAAGNPKVQNGDGKRGAETAARSPDGSDRTGTASPRCAPACVGPGGSAE